MMELEYIGDGECYNYPINGKVVTGDVIRVASNIGNTLLNSPSKWKVHGTRKKGKNKMILGEVTSEDKENGSI